MLSDDLRYFSTAAHNIGVFVKNVGRHHRPDNAVIELLASVLYQLFSHHAHRERLSVRAVREHRIDGIARSNDFGSDRYFIT